MIVVERRREKMMELDTVYSGSCGWLELGREEYREEKEKEEEEEQEEGEERGGRGRSTGRRRSGESD